MVLIVKLHFTNHNVIPLWEDFVHSKMLLNAHFNAFKVITIIQTINRSQTRTQGCAIDYVVHFFVVVVVCHVKNDVID